MTTLVVIRSLQVGDRRFAHGEQLPPGLLPKEAIDLHLDRKELVAYDSDERRSLHRLLHHFSGCSESEQLTPEERSALCL
jgi:hypothetical protein